MLSVFQVSRMPTGHHRHKSRKVTMILSIHYQLPVQTESAFTSNGDAHDGDG